MAPLADKGQELPHVCPRLLQGLKKLRISCFSLHKLQEVEFIMALADLAEDKFEIFVFYMRLHMQI